MMSVILRGLSIIRKTIAHFIMQILREQIWLRWNIGVLLPIQFSLILLMNLIKISGYPCESPSPATTFIISSTATW